MILLRFIYLTLPNFAGKLLKALNKDGKQETNCNKAKNRQKDTSARPQLAPNSQWRVASEKIGREAHLLAPSSHPTRHGELSKEQNRQKHRFARHGEWSYLGGEQGRLKLPMMTWHKPTGEETSTRHREQRNSRGELMQMGKLINSPRSFLEGRELFIV